MRNKKWIAFLLAILILISVDVFSVSFEWLPGLKVTASIFGVLLCMSFVLAIQIFIDGFMDERYNRRFQLSDNILIFPDLQQ